MFKFLILLDEKVYIKLNEKLLDFLFKMLDYKDDKDNKGHRSQGWVSFLQRGYGIQFQCMYIACNKYMLHFALRGFAIGVLKLGL